MKDEVLMKTHLTYLNRSAPTKRGSSALTPRSERKVNMKTMTAENSQPHLQHSRWRESSGRPFRSLSRSWLIPLALVVLASTARGGSGQTPPPCGTNHIVGVTDCNSTNVTIQLGQFCPGPWVAQCGGVTLSGTYNYGNQTFTACRPAGLPPGNCLLTIWKNGKCLASTNIFLCSCVCTSCPAGPPGPPGPAGATGAMGPAGPAGATGAMGPQGIRGLTGATGPMGPAGAMGPAGPAGTNGLNGTNGLVGPAGPAGANGLDATNGFVGPAGPAGPAGATGPMGLTGATGPAGPAGTNGLNGTGSGSSEYAYIYNLSAQVVPLEAAVTFSDNGIGTAGFTHGLGSSDLIVVNQGDYKVTFSVSGTEPNQFALFINGVVVAESVYGSGAGTQQNTGQVIVALQANDVLTLRNHTSAAAVTLAAAPPIGGTVAAVNASILVQKLN